MVGEWRMFQGLKQLHSSRGRRGRNDVRCRSCDLGHHRIEFQIMLREHTPHFQEPRRIGRGLSPLEREGATGRGGLEASDHEPLVFANLDAQGRSREQCGAQTALDHANQGGHAGGGDRGRRRGARDGAHIECLIAKAVTFLHEDQTGALDLLGFHGLGHAQGVADRGHEDEGFDDEVRLYVKPTDQQGRTLVVPGRAVVQLLDVTGDEPAVLTERTWEPGAWDEAHRSGFTGDHFTLVLPLPDDLRPGLDTLNVVLELTEANRGIVRRAQAVYPLHR